MEAMGGMIGGAFGAVGSIVGASIAADAQKYTANTNFAIALYNLYARERERTQARYEAQRIEQKQNLGYQTAAGVKTRFVPGVGWVEEEPAIMSAIRGREQGEQMQRLAVDAPMRRQQLQANQIQQIRERDRASALFDQMKRQPGVTPSEIEHLLLGAQSQASNRAFDETANIAARQALRTNTNPRSVMADIGRARSQEQAGMAGAARLQGLQLAPQIEEAQQKADANMYNLLATRASAMPEVSFSPTPLDSSVAQTARASAATGDAALKAAMMEGGRMPFVPPNYGAANLAGAVGAAGQGFMTNLNRSGVFNDSGAGNLWASIGNDYRRMREDQGSFAG